MGTEYNSEIIRLQKETLRQKMYLYKQALELPAYSDSEKIERDMNVRAANEAIISALQNMSVLVGEEEAQKIYNDLRVRLKV